MNAENLADGKGLTEKTARPLFEAGIDAMTGGNHLWDRAESLDYIRRNPRIIKPMNYPSATPGSIYHTLERGDIRLTIINLCGQVYMPACDSPFTALENLYEDLLASSNTIIMDFHAESTAEKRAMGWFADGKISAVLGTHTHIQTADEEILPGGTAYITDVGMTGSHDSVIGVKKDLIVEKFRTSIPVRYEASDRGLQINAICLEIDQDSGRALSISRIKYDTEI
jgi:metallophosphoesterase (TIGR00282 family)